MSRLSADRLRELFVYDPDTGVFKRKCATGYRGCHRAGETVGWESNESGHLRVTVDGEMHYCHRLAFLYMTGSWPASGVDHINGDASDNRWSNLRDVPQVTNTQNFRSPGKANTSGYLGVSFDKARNKFAACIRLESGKRLRARFDTAEEAAAFYLANKRAHHAGCTI